MVFINSNLMFLFSDADADENLRGIAPLGIISSMLVCAEKKQNGVGATKKQEKCGTR